MTTIDDRPRAWTHFADQLTEGEQLLFAEAENRGTLSNQDLLEMASEMADANELQRRCDVRYTRATSTNEVVANLVEGAAASRWTIGDGAPASAWLSNPIAQPLPHREVYLYRAEIGDRPSQVYVETTVDVDVDGRVLGPARVTVDTGSPQGGMSGADAARLAEAIGVAAAAASQVVTDSDVEATHP